MTIYDTHEGVRLRMNQQREGHWNRWGPFQASGTPQVGRRLLACWPVTQTEPGPIGDAKQRIRILEFASCTYRPLISPDPFGSGLVSD
jgi:hypothetical protein